MVKAKLLLVVGPGGGRMDFVAGWLGSLSNFVDSNWSIDPVTRQSYGSMRFTKPLDNGAPLESVWPKHFELSADTDVYIAGTGHGMQLNLIQDKINAGLVRVLSISTMDPTTNLKRIKWEHVVKTFLSTNKLSYTPVPGRKKWLIDSVINKPKDQITNEDRIVAVDQQLKIPVKYGHPGNSANGATNIEYNLLFQVDGSRLLCRELGIDVIDCYHQYWNSMLPLIDSPDTLTVWGHTWNYNDYFTD